MPIYSILQNSAFEPERIELVATAFEETLRFLNIVDRKDPLAEDIAKAIFRAAQKGESNPERLQRAAIAELGLAGPLRPAPPKSTDAGKRARPTVLIVENDEAFAYAASRFLEARGYHSIVAVGSMAAFRELDERSVDVVITDVRLGHNEPHGIALGRMIRNRDRNMPVLLVTAFPDLLEQEKPLPGEAFVKPIDLGRLAAAVEASLARV